VINSSFFLCMNVFSPRPTKYLLTPRVSERATRVMLSGELFSHACTLMPLSLFMFSINVKMLPKTQSI
jgi:hypothetical protein